MNANKEYIIFWGASKCGQINLSFWLTIGKTPDFFTCNDPNMWGKTFFGIPVISPNEVLRIKIKKIYITSYARYEITNQLLELGLPECQIIPHHIPYYSSVPELYRMLEQRYLSKNKDKKNIIEPKNLGFIFEYAYGGSLGGTQSWAYQEQEKLNKIISTESVVPSDQPPISSDLNPIVLERSSKVNLFDSACEYFLSCKYNFFIGMIGSEILAAACFVKRAYKIELTVIAFCHADCDEYYDSYVLLQESIDFCLVISKKMQSALISRGFPAKKIIYYPWEPSYVKLYDERNKNYNFSLRIAYVGRIYIQQKRCDNLMLLAKLLRAKGVDFILSICGDGEYLSTLKEQIKQNHLENNVNYLGCIDHSEVSSFWSNQDIYVSCSEHEGHSLSQFEALSCGAVAVCTDCSGVSDDVIHEYSGFIVDVGDIEKMAEYIELLSKDRELLELMKKRNAEIFAKKKDEYCDPILSLIR